MQSEFTVLVETYSTCSLASPLRKLSGRFDFRSAALNSVQNDELVDSRGFQNPRPLRPEETLWRVYYHTPTTSPPGLVNLGSCRQHSLSPLCIIRYPIVHLE